jgi:hypothetical protein
MKNIFLIMLKITYDCISSTLTKEVTIHDHRYILLGNTIRNQSQ